ncbi:MAG: BON domain-containing protein [Burkholderiales bacterium]|nr:BON domain-containing protein [Burkholderiales bacterium]
MKLKTLANILITVGLALPLASRAADDADSDRGGAHAWVKDSVITTQIKAQLAANQPSSLAKVHVDTDAKGYVRLSGRVDTQADADRAVAVASTVKGVYRVENRLAVTGDR